MTYAIGKDTLRAVALRVVREHVHDLMDLTPATEETSHNVTEAKSKVLHCAVHVVRN